MSVLSIIAIVVVALLHVLFAWIEMTQWETRGAKIVPSYDAEMLKLTKVMAANQGLYNLFIASGLLWALVIDDAACQYKVALCILIFVVIAGLYGAATVSKKILYVQAVPAAIAILLLLLT